MTSQFRGNAEEEEREARTRTQAQRRPKLEQERSGARKVVRVALDRSRQHGHFIWDRNSQLWFNPRTRYFYNQETNSYSRAPDGVFYTAAQIQALNHIRQQFVEKRPAGFFWDPKSNMGAHSLCMLGDVFLPSTARSLLPGRLSLLGRLRASWSPTVVSLCFAYSPLVVNVCIVGVGDLL